MNQNTSSSINPGSSAVGLSVDEFHEELIRSRQLINTIRVLGIEMERRTSKSGRSNPGLTVQFQIIKPNVKDPWTRFIPIWADNIELVRQLEVGTSYITISEKDDGGYWRWIKIQAVIDQEVSHEES